MQTLYDLVLNYTAENMRTNGICQRYDCLPQQLRVDLLLKVFDIGHVTVLGRETEKFENILLLLKHSRLKFHRLFQTLMDDNHYNIAELYTDFIENQLHSHRSVEKQNSCPPLLNKPKYCTEKIIMQFASAFGSFLCEAGWYKYAERVYVCMLKSIQQMSDESSIIRALNCSSKLLRVLNSNCSYKKTTALLECVIDMLSELSPEAREKYNKASLYNEIAILLFAQSRYEEAFRHSLYALEELRKPDTPIPAMIEVLRLCSKGCVVRREFKLAERLIKHAVKISYDFYGDDHNQYADTVADYAFFLLNRDQITSAVSMYEKALKIREATYGGVNLQIAISCEDLAYALYVQEYNTGRFTRATAHAEKAISMLGKILPANHLLLASSKRVRALILEEMAIDLEDSEQEKSLLNEALMLHEESLALAVQSFGERNIQTAKHYGNLGRLYQTLTLWERADEMHQRAMNIKEQLLGAEDYEVALSAGHLASLYAYDMGKMPEAEALYKRSIAITLKLFGAGYSGLEYDYEGLVHLYNQTGEADKVTYYRDELENWRTLRSKANRAQDVLVPLAFLEDEQTYYNHLTKEYVTLLEWTNETICEQNSLLNNPSFTSGWLNT